MVHPEFTKILATDHVEQLRRDARHVPSTTDHVAADSADVELRLCRVSDDPALDLLGALEGRPVPRGRMVVAAVRGRVVAAQPLDGGDALRDPFVPTEHLLPLLELRAAQLREPAPRRGLLPRYVNLMRGSIHA
jgi:hypothetical protein